MSSHPLFSEPDELGRCQAARETIELFVLNLRTIRRSNLPSQAQARIREIVRLGLETIEILQRALDEAEHG